MQLDHEEALARNPVITAKAFWHFTSQYAEGGNLPSLEHFFISMGMLFHEATVRKTEKMNFDSGLTKAIFEQPDIVIGLQQRILAYRFQALSGLQCAVAAGLLERCMTDSMPLFKLTDVPLPQIMRSGGPGVRQVTNSARRLGAWFASDELTVLKRKLSILL